MGLLNKTIKECDNTLLCGTVVRDTSLAPKISTKICNITPNNIALLGLKNMTNCDVHENFDRIYLTKLLVNTLEQFNINTISPNKHNHNIIILSNIFDNIPGINVISPGHVKIGHSDEVVGSSQFTPYKMQTTYSWYYVDSQIYKYRQTLKNWNIDSFGIVFINNGDSFLTYDECSFKSKIVNFNGHMFPIFNNSRLVCDHFIISGDLNKFSDNLFSGLELDSQIMSFEDTTSTTHYFALNKNTKLIGMHELFDSFINSAHKNCTVHLKHICDTQNYKIFSTDLSSEFVVIMCDIEKIVYSSIENSYELSQQTVNDYLINTLCNYTEIVTRAFSHDPY